MKLCYEPNTNDNNEIVTTAAAQNTELEISINASERCAFIHVIF